MLVRFEYWLMGYKFDLETLAELEGDGDIFSIAWLVLWAT